MMKLSKTDNYKHDLVIGYFKNYKNRRVCSKIPTVYHKQTV